MTENPFMYRRYSFPSFMILEYRPQSLFLLVNVSFPFVTHVYWPELMEQ